MSGDRQEAFWDVRRQSKLPKKNNNKPASVTCLEAQRLGLKQEHTEFKDSPIYTPSSRPV